MNEFEWRRQLRELRQPVMPQRDVWASIDAALDNMEKAGADLPRPILQPARATHPRRWQIAAGVAASLLLVSTLGWHVLHMAAPVPVANITQSAGPDWKPADPRLAGAATELDAARMELQQAIGQAPNSPALRRLLMRTEFQQTQLRQLAREAG